MILIFIFIQEEYAFHFIEVSKVEKRSVATNLNKCNVFLQSLLYSKYVIGGEFNIDPMNMKNIIKWPTPTNFTNVKKFVGETQVLYRFIVSFSFVVAPFHAITITGNNFHWKKNQQFFFED